MNIIDIIVAIVLILFLGIIIYATMTAASWEDDQERNYDEEGDNDEEEL